MRFTNVSAAVGMPASTLRRSRSAGSAALIVRGNSAQVIFVGGGDVHGTRHSLAVAGVRGNARYTPPRRSSARRREVTSVGKTSCGSMHHHMGGIVVNIEAASNRRCFGLADVNRGGHRHNRSRDWRCNGRGFLSRRRCLYWRSLSVPDPLTLPSWMIHCWFRLRDVQFGLSLAHRGQKFIPAGILESLNLRGCFRGSSSEPITLG